MDVPGCCQALSPGLTLASSPASSCLCGLLQQLRCLALQQQQVLRAGGQGLRVRVRAQGKGKGRG